MPSLPIQELDALLKDSKTVLLTPHIGPDGDALGAMLAFYHGVRKAYPHLEIHPVMTGRLPEVYRFMPGSELVRDLEKETGFHACYDLAVSFDCGAKDRLAEAEKYFDAAKMSVNIDHHVSNNRYGKLNIVVDTASASGEVVADLLEGLGVAMDRDIAINVYTAIVTDTGGFKYSNTTAKLLRLAANLVEVGADPEIIHKKVYEECTLSQIRLQAEAVHQLQLNADHTVAWTYISRQMLDRLKAEDEYIDGIVERLRQIDTVLIAAVFKERRDGNIKVSLRSDSHQIDVSEIMARFGGGGHKMAAGCTIPFPYDEAKKQLLPMLDKAVERVLPGKV